MYVFHCQSKKTQEAMSCTFNNIIMSIHKSGTRLTFKTCAADYDCDYGRNALDCTS